MCADLSWLHDLQEVRPEAIQGLNGSFQTTAKGTAKLRCRLRNGRVITLTLDDVYYVPGLPYNLISLSKLAQFGAWMHTLDCCLFNKSGREAA